MKTPDQLRLWALQMSDAFGCTAIQALGMALQGVAWLSEEVETDVDEDGVENHFVSQWKIEKFVNNAHACHGKLQQRAQNTTGTAPVKENGGGAEP